jgi:hypothetical protein
MFLRILKAFRHSESLAAQRIQSPYVEVYLPICGGLPTHMWRFTYPYMEVYLPIK